MLVSPSSPSASGLKMLVIVNTEAEGRARNKNSREDVEKKLRNFDNFNLIPFTILLLFFLLFLANLKFSSAM